MNPLFNALGGGQMPGALGNFQQMTREYQKIVNPLRMQHFKAIA